MLTNPSTRPPTTTTPSSLKTAPTTNGTSGEEQACFGYSYVSLPSAETTPQTKKKGGYTELPDLDAIPPAGPAAVVPQPAKPKITAAPPAAAAASSSSAGGAGGGGKDFLFSPTGSI